VRREARGYTVGMVDDSQADRREALKRVAVALKRSEIPYALIGGYAVWARGGPESENDVDFMVAAEDAKEAANSLVEQGFEVRHPPEDWLFKVDTDGTTVDVIFRDSGSPAERSAVEASGVLEVLSVLMPVLPATQLMVQKLNALDEHMCDFANLLSVARALREQVDWDQVRQQTGHNDFAAAFLYLLERLDIVDRPTA
jgi:hypothetical protein